MSLKPSDPVPMLLEAAPEFPASQEFVYIDVGGKIFKMLRQTVTNYPDSLLAKLLRDCPDFGKEQQPVYIDRSPATFEWILEIYRSVAQNPACVLKQCFRRGDYEATMPRKSAEYLQRELDFYQLPSLGELGLSSCCFPSGQSFSADMASKKLVQEIVQEIKESDVENMFPWCVYIYYELRTKAERHIFVIPDAVRSMLSANDIVKFIKDKRQIDFGDICHSVMNKVYDAYDGKFRDLGFFYLDKSSYCPYYCFSNKKTVFAFQFPADEIVGMISEEAQCRGLSIEARNLDSVKDNAVRKEVDFTDLPYMYCSFLRK